MSPEDILRGAIKAMVTLGFALRIGEGRAIEIIHEEVKASWSEAKEMCREG